MSPDRYKAMTSAANTFYEHITNKGSTMLLEVSAADVLKGSKDILQPLILKVNTIVVDIDLDEIRYGVFTGDTVYEFSGNPAENVDKMLDLIAEDISSFNVVVKIRGVNFNPSDLIKASEIVKENGFSSCIIG